jgi:hypothetical protein
MTVVLLLYLLVVLCTHCGIWRKYPVETGKVEPMGQKIVGNDFEQPKVGPKGAGPDVRSENLAFYN